MTSEHQSRPIRQQIGSAGTGDKHRVRAAPLLFFVLVNSFARSVSCSIFFSSRFRRFTSSSSVCAITRPRECSHACC